MRAKAQKENPNFICGLLISVLLTASAGAGTFYPDCDIAVTSGDHLIIKYHPQFSEDYQALGNAVVYPIDGRQVWARAFIVAVPSGGDIDFSFNFTRAAVTESPAASNYIGEHQPLAIKEMPVESRGHRLIRIVVFPQRIEQNRLVSYSDFDIDVHITGGNQESVPASIMSRLDSLIAMTTVNPSQFLSFATAGRPQIARKAVADLFDQTSQWAKITVSTEGVTRIFGSQLEQAGLSLTNLASDSLHLFYAGGFLPPDDPQGIQPQLMQVSIKVEDGGDGIFNSGDYFLFFAESASRFEYDGDKPEHLYNSYNEDNYYWVTTSALGGVAMRWPVIDGTPLGAIDAAAFRQQIRLEQNNRIKVDGDGRIRDYYTWYWSNSDVVSSSLNMINPVPGDSIDIIIAASANLAGTDVLLNGQTMTRYSIGGQYHWWISSSVAVNGINTLQLNLASGISEPYLDYVIIDYPRKNQVSGGQLFLNSYGKFGSVQYLVTGFSPADFVLDITDDGNPGIISGVLISGDSARFERNAQVTPISRYAVYSLSNLNVAAAVEKFDPGDLRTDLSQYDCIVVSPRSFRSAMQEYVAYRETTGNVRIKLVAVEDIYDRFGFGMMSPQAIRQYLKFAYENYDAPAPYAVNFVGDGHYDFLNNLGLSNPSYLPPFVWGREISGGDDNYVYFGKLDSLDSDGSYVVPGDHGWDMMTARWPVNSAREIRDFIDKLKIYESDAAQGSWRSRLTFVADDEFKNESSTEIIHTAQTESLAVYHTPPAFVEEKIYATDYQFASNGEKPTANDDIVRAINNGTLMINYIGHGSADIWADEHIFTRTSDLGRLTNTDMPTVVIAGSCSIGKFDQPDKEGMAEMLFRQEGGAIASLSATRLVYSSSNAIFNYDLYDAIFGGMPNLTEAAFATKMLHQFQNLSSVVRNDRSYVVLGDVLCKMRLPKYEIAFTPGGDSLMTPLNQFTFSGQIIDENGQPAAVDGPLYITVYDSEIFKHHPLGLDYSLGGPAIFRGAVAVAGGNFSGGFMVPLDIDYGGNSARITGFGQFAPAAAIGSFDSLAVAATPGVTTDKTGPDVEISFQENPDFVSGERIPVNATMIITLGDSSGINLTGGLGHRIELIIDDDNNSIINLTDYFVYQTGSFRDGQVIYTLPDLTAGRHTFKVKAWDNANNPASIEIEAVTSQEGRVALVDVMNYPNPMEDFTEFFFELSESVEYVELKIFTLAGRMIYSFHADNLTAGRNRNFRWAGRDFDGDRVAQGVYIYKITAQGRSGIAGINNSAESYGKLVVLN